MYCIWVDSHTAVSTLMGQTHLRMLLVGPACTRQLRCDPGSFWCCLGHLFVVCRLIETWQPSYVDSFFDPSKTSMSPSQPHQVILQPMFSPILSVQIVWEHAQTWRLDFSHPPLPLYLCPVTRSYFVNDEVGHNPDSHRTSEYQPWPVRSGTISQSQPLLRKEGKLTE